MDSLIEFIKLYLFRISLMENSIIRTRFPVVYPYLLISPRNSPKILIFKGFTDQFVEFGLSGIKLTLFLGI